MRWVFRFATLLAALALSASAAAPARAATCVGAGLFPVFGLPPTMS